MLACCELISSPLRLSIANIQSFIIKVHDSYHEFYQILENIKHHQKRLKKATASKVKVQSDLDSEIQDLKNKLGEIQSQHQDPYMEKVRVHYPELHQTLLTVQDRIRKDPRLKALFPTELL